MEEKKQVNFGTGNNIRLYKAINPNITTTNKGVLYFNADKEDNALPNKLVDLYTNASAVHSNLINLKRNLIIGEGFTPVVAETELQAFIDKTNKQGDNLNDMLEKLALDFAIMEACAIQVLYDAEGNISNLYHVDVSFVRSEALNALGFPENYYISKEWGDISNKANRRATEKTRAVKVAAYNPATWKEDGGVQLFYIKRYTTGAQFYSIPSYISITPYCELQYELSKYNLSKLKKGFLSTGMMVLAGSPDDEQKKEFIRKFESNYIGSDKDNVLYIWTESPEDKPEWVPMQTDGQDGVMDSLIAISSQQIAVGHGATLEVAGIDTKGVSLGGDANKLAVGLAFYNKNVISVLQNTIVSAVNKLLSVNDLGKVYIPYVPLDQEISSDTDDEATEVPTEEVANQIIKELKVN